MTIRNSNGATETVKLSRDYTMKILECNRNLTWYKKYQGHWFSSFFICEVPDELTYIKISYS